MQRGVGHLAEVMGRLARDLQAEPNLQETLQEIVEGAARIIPGAEAVAVSLVEAKKQIRTPASVGEMARVVDALQYETGEGPCLDAIWEQDVVRVPQVGEASSRWPQFAARASEAGVGSILAFRLFVTESALGALNLYSSSSGAFEGPETEQIGRLFATHAAIALAASQKVDEITVGLRNRDVIGVAKGILVERHRISEQSAFRVLVRVSQTTNRKLSEVADELVRSGALPHSGD